MVNLVSLIIHVGMMDIAGFTLGGYLIEKTLEIGTGKVWGIIKEKLRDKQDSFDSHLYTAIENSVSHYFEENINKDILAAVCEQMFYVWCNEGYLTPEKVKLILHKYSEYADNDDILEWYRAFQDQVVKDNTLYHTFMVNNMQLNREQQKEYDKKLDKILSLLQDVDDEEKRQKAWEYPKYLSSSATDVNPFYIGRDYIENEIWNTLVLNRESILLYGIGGIGKTEIAKAVLKKIISFPRAVTGIYKIIWANYINGSFKESLVEADYEAKRMPNKEEAWEYVYNIIQELREELLIVIDNVETIEQDEELKKLNDLPCRIIVTSRMEKIGGLRGYSVEHLSKEDCQKVFYYYYVGDPDDYFLDKILELIDYHTVMLELLAKTANMEEATLKAFYKMLVDNGFRLSEEEVAAGHPLLQTEKRVTEQLKILFNIVKCRVQDKDLLCQLSVIPSIPFKYNEVKNWINIKSKSQLEYLVKMGWLKSDRELISTYVMHSVIASAIRFQNEEHLYEKCKNIIRAITKEMEYSEQEHGSEKAYLIPFSWSISDVFKGHLFEEEDAIFLTNLGHIYFDIGNYDNAYEFFSRALEVDKMATGEYSLSVSDDLYNLADVRFSMYQFKEALSYLRRALVIRKKNFSSDNMEIVVLMKLFAGIYARLNRTDWAEKIYIWVADKLENNPEADILQISTYYSDIASFFRERGCSGDYEKAELYYKKAESGMESVYGTKPHPEMAAFYDELALLYDNMGKYNEALSLLLKALEMRKCILQEEHPDMVQSYTSIGLVYYELTEYDNALEYLNYALDLANKIWTGAFSFKADIYNNLGLVYRNIDEYEKAEDFYKRSLQIRKSIYPKNHPLVLAIKNNIAQVYASEKKYEEAAVLYEMVVRDYCEGATEKEKESSFLATIYDNLSSTYRSLGKYKDAINACMKGRDMRRNIFGEQSIDYALSLNNLALIYYEMDKLSEAQKFFEKALNIKKSVLPEKHCHISIGYFNLGLVYDKLNQDSEALDNYRKAMEIDNELGAYEDVLFTAEYMAEVYERNGMIEEAEIYRSLGKNM